MGGGVFNTLLVVAGASPGFRLHRGRRILPENGVEFFIGVGRPFAAKGGAGLQQGAHRPRVIGVGHPAMDVPIEAGVQWRAAELVALEQRRLRVGSEEQFHEFAIAVKGGTVES